MISGYLLLVNPEPRKWFAVLGTELSPIEAGVDPIHESFDQLTKKLRQDKAVLVADMKRWRKDGLHRDARLVAVKGGVYKDRFFTHSVMFTYEATK